MRRGWSDALMSVGALTILAVILVSLDERVRDYAWRFVSRTTVADARLELRDVAGVVVDAIRDHTMAHAPLTIFVVAGVVLFLFMVRT